MSPDATVMLLAAIDIIMGIILALSFHTVSRLQRALAKTNKLNTALIDALGKKIVAEVTERMNAKGEK